VVTADHCHADCTSWLEHSLAAALRNQRRFLCGCLPAGTAGGKALAELRVLISSEGVAGVHLVRAPGEAKAARCLTRQAGLAVQSWLRLKPGWYNQGGGWQQDRVAASWRKTEASVQFDWEGLTCAGSQGEPDPGPPRLSAAWRREHPDGLVCRVFHCAPSPRCCKPRNVVWQFPLLSR